MQKGNHINLGEKMNKITVSERQSHSRSSEFWDILGTTPGAIVTQLNDLLFHE